MNKILVLLATYNGEKYLDEQIKSILNQVDCDVHIIIGDDQSIDGTKKILKELKKLYEQNFTVKINNTKLGFSKNFYNLIINSKNLDQYDYVALSDQDDIYELDKFINQIKLFQNDKQVGQSCSVKCFGASRKILNQSPKITKYDYLFEGAGQGCTFLLKIEFFRKLRSFIIDNYDLVSKFIFHDWLCYLFARASGYDWVFNQTPYVNYRIHKSNSFGNKFTFHGIFLRLKKLFTGWYYQQVKFANLISVRINKDIPLLYNLGFINLLHLLLFKGRRRLPDRLIAFIFLVPFLLKKKKDI